MTVNYRPLEREEVKKIQLALLDEFVNFCEKNDLYYTLAGGTLLGAVRHKGFIPWDDDIDVIMPRGDYNKLIMLDRSCDTLWNNQTQLLYWGKDNSRYPFVKLSRTNTLIIEKYGDDFKENRVWIDIFPLDGIADDKETQIKLFGKELLLRRMFMLKNARLGEGKTKIKKYAKFLIKPFLKVVSNKWFCKKMDEIAQTYRYEDCSTIAVVIWGYGIRECMRKEDYLIPIKIEFENKRYNAPSNYDMYLTNLYGDYMKLPQEKDRITHEYKAFLI